MRYYDFTSILVCMHTSHISTHTYIHIHASKTNTYKQICTYPPISLELYHLRHCITELWLLSSRTNIQYIPRNMHTVFALLCFVVIKHWLIFPYQSALLHWHCGNLTIAPVPAKQPWWKWINISCELIMNDCITTTKQSTTKPCAYFLGYTIAAMDGTYHWVLFIQKLFSKFCEILKTVGCYSCQ